MLHTNPMHLSQVGETYAAHAKHALWMAGAAAKMAVVLVIHAALPWVLDTYASDKLEQMIRYRQTRKKD